MALALKLIFLLALHYYWLLFTSSNSSINSSILLYPTVSLSSPISSFNFTIFCTISALVGSSSKSTERFIEALSPSYDIAPPPTPPHFYTVNMLFLFLSLPLCRRSSLLTGGGGEGVGEEPNHTKARKPGPLYK
jgi:hypothetical protein